VGVRLGLDFGTSSTVGMVQRPDGTVTPLLFDASPLLSSAVHAAPDGTLLTGADAQRAALGHPGALEPHPKRRIDDGVVWLGDREVAVVDLVAAVLARSGGEARRVIGGPPVQAVLTHPAAWGRTRRAALAEAARRAGLPPATLVPEPVAAAAYFAAVLGHGLPPGRTLAVYDLGAGTFDVSAVRRSVDGFEVIATAGVDDIGGLDLDAAVVEHVRALTPPAAAAWQRLDRPQTTADQRARLTLWQGARAAKEMLSRHPYADVHVPLAEADLHLTREEFEELARPYLDRTVSVTLDLVRSAGVPHGELAGVLLVGGSTRIPLVATLLRRRLDVDVTVIDQPELVVAHGSLYAVAPPPVPPQPPPTWRAEPPPAAARWAVLPRDFPVHLVELIVGGRVGYTVRTYAEDDDEQISAVFASVAGRLPLFPRPEQATAFAAAADNHDMCTLLHWESLRASMSRAFLPLIDDNRYDLDLPAVNLELDPAHWLPDVIVKVGDVALELIEALDIEEGDQLLGAGTPLDDLDDALRQVGHRPMRRYLKAMRHFDGRELADQWQRVADVVDARLDWLN
jgi:Hsp70 protein